MFRLLNQFSYLLLSLVVLIPVGYFALIADRRTFTVVIFFLVVVLLILVNLILRVSPNQLTSLKEFQSTLALGKPTIVQFYSNF